jgi:hypothetical protein
MSGFCRLNLRHGDSMLLNAQHPALHGPGDAPSLPDVMGSPWQAELSRLAMSFFPFRGGAPTPQLRKRSSERPEAHQGHTALEGLQHSLLLPGHGPGWRLVCELVQSPGFLFTLGPGPSTALVR